MTQFEQNLHNLIATLETQKSDYKAKKWNEIQSGTLAEYRRAAEAECAQGIELLRTKRDGAIAEREETLRTALDAEVDAKFSEAEEYLKKAQALFSVAGNG